MGCAKDIIEHCGVARFLFTDFPLGNPCGEPFNLKQQQEIFSMALDLLESATAPRTTVQTPFVWPEGDGWKKLIFTKNQPFLDEKQTEKYERAKDQYRQLKKKGKV
ncbi:MAG: hypothetical protein SV375_06175 [Thermodesulfobacteriota bacterium]|nr:hypothetical protein [Thermodesulfobacteriota bacterium]